MGENLEYPVRADAEKQNEEHHVQQKVHNNHHNFCFLMLSQALTTYQARLFLKNLTLLLACASTYGPSLRVSHVVDMQILHLGKAERVSCLVDNLQILERKSFGLVEHSSLL